MVTVVATAADITELTIDPKAIDEAIPSFSRTW